jgi:hypothetical protein
MTILQTIKRNFGICFNATLLAILPLVQSVQDYLPGLQQYLTSDVYKIVGLITVIVNILAHLKAKDDKLIDK